MKIRLCKGCIDQLREYNPYIDDNGSTIPIDKLDIEVVPLKECDNYKLGKQ